MSTTQQAPLGPRIPANAAGIGGAQRQVSSPVLPSPPSDAEKYTYIDRNLPYLTLTLVISATCLIISQLRFELHSPATWPFLLFTATYICYQVISLPVNFTGR